MIKLNEILQAYKALLDADSTMDSLLDVIPGDSRVRIGTKRENLMNPSINIRMDETSNNGLNMFQTSIYFDIFVNAGVDSIDEEKLSQIADRIQTLINGMKPDTTTHRIKQCLFVQEVGTVPDFKEYSGIEEGFKSVVFEVWFTPKT